MKKKKKEEGGDGDHMVRNHANWLVESWRCLTGRLSQLGTRSAVRSKLRKEM